MVKSYSERMGEMIGHDAINIRILTNEYGVRCKSLFEDPTGRLQYWIGVESE